MDDNLQLTNYLENQDNLGSFGRSYTVQNTAYIGDEKIKFNTWKSKKTIGLLCFILTMILFISSMTSLATVSIADKFCCESKSSSNIRQSNQSGIYGRLTGENDTMIMKHKGERGDKGQMGAKGTKGDKGLLGDKGSKGIAGIRGPVGFRGSHGLKGDKGEKGLKGEKGERGLIGTTGLSGPNGTKGIRGDKGLTGSKGLVGNKGPVGDKGQIGDKGPAGEKGEKGQIGSKAMTGDKGPAGNKGSSGDKGAVGQKGEKGSAGQKGAPGEDAIVKSCGSGWTLFMRHCYFFGLRKKSWHNAQRDCKNGGGNLVKIENGIENWFLKSYARVRNLDGFWIGAHDTSTEARMVWVSDGSLVSSGFKDFLPGEPNNGGNKEDCVHMWKARSYLWNDWLCSNSLQYVCKK